MTKTEKLRIINLKGVECASSYYQLKSEWQKTTNFNSNDVFQYFLRVQHHIGSQSIRLGLSSPHQTSIQ